MTSSRRNVLLALRDVKETWRLLSVYLIDLKIVILVEAGGVEPIHAIENT